MLLPPLKVFNTEGEFLLKFGSNGEGNGQFNAPTGVAVDVNGNIIVADWGNSRIQVSTRILMETSIKKKQAEVDVYSSVAFTVSGSTGLQYMSL